MLRVGAPNRYGHVVIASHFSLKVAVLNYCVTEVAALPRGSVGTIRAGMAAPLMFVKRSRETVKPETTV